MEDFASNFVKLSLLKSMETSFNLRFSMATEKNEMMRPIIRGETKTVRALLDAGYPIEEPVYSDATPLFYAVDEGKTPIVRLLIERGANVNARMEQFQYTPLMVAAQNLKLDIVKALLAAGADHKLADKYGRTALIFAARGETKAAPAVVAELLRAGTAVAGDPTILVGLSRTRFRRPSNCWSRPAQMSMQRMYVILRW